jgi:hypothetical protein
MSQQTIEQPQPRTGLLIWMIVSQVLTVLSLVIWLMMAGLSVMAFDSGVTAEAWTVVILVWSYPILPIVLVIGAWRAYAKRKNALAAVLSGLSFAPPILLFLCMAITSFGWYAMYLNNGLLNP